MCMNVLDKGFTGSGTFDDNATDTGTDGQGIVFLEFLKLVYYIYSANFVISVV